MPYRRVAAAKLGEFLNVIAHPRRIHIIEELRGGERDVGSLQAALGTSHSNVSQHLALLRAHRVVRERRDGRYVFYRLCTPELAVWLLEGTQFLPEMVQEVEQVKSDVENARQAWSLLQTQPLDQ